MKRASMIQKFFREEKTARIFVLMILTSLGIWIFSDVFETEEFKDFGIWGFVWGWILLDLTYVAPSLYRRMLQVNEIKDSLQKIGWGLFSSFLGIGSLFVFWVVFTGAGKIGGTVAMGRVVLSLTLVGMSFGILGLILIGGLWARTKFQKWFQSPDSPPQPPREPSTIHDSKE